jgi:nucleoid-associated protein YgaU
MPIRGWQEAVAPRDPGGHTDTPGTGHTGSVAAGPRRYDVTTGETFPSIARLYYGSERYGAALWQFNRGRFPHPQELRAGDLLVIPTLDELDPSAGRRAQSATGATTALAPASSSNEAALALPRSPEFRADWVARPTGRNRGEADRDPARSHSWADRPARGPQPPVQVVRRYETLRSIARDRLGDVHRADEILELNQDRLADPYQLTPGQRLVLPLDAGPSCPSP